MGVPRLLYIMSNQWSNPFFIGICEWLELNLVSLEQDECRNPLGWSQGSSNRAAMPVWDGGGCLN